MVASSILPVTIHNGKLFFLFGKENELEDSATGWSDFGGKCEKNESLFKSALREGSEELTGFLGDSTDIEKLIKKNGGTYKVEYPKYQYNVHIFYMEYDANLPIYYNQTHKYLWNRMDKNILNDSKFFEKIEINWFSVDEIQSRKFEFRGFYQEIIELFVKDIKKITKFIRSRSSKPNKTRKNKTRTINH